MRGSWVYREARNYSRISTRDSMTDAKWWDFTCPEDKASSDEELIERLDQLCDRYVFGHEVGKENGYRHIQGRVVFKVGKELATIKKQTCEWLPSAHWCKTHVRNFDYCEKEGNYVRSWEGALRKYALITLRPWQEEALDLWENQNDRQILCITDYIGNRGKTFFSKYMEATHRADVCPVTDGEASNYIEYCLNHPAKGYIFDVPRCDTIKGKKNMWKAIEQIKNGLLYDRRYTSRKMWIDPPKIMVFANELPDRENLSADRWQLYGITDYGPQADILIQAEGVE